MADYVNIRVRKDTYERLKEKAAGMPLVKYLDDLSCGHWESADDMVERLDSKYDNGPEVEAIDTSGWINDIAPECCCDFYYNYFYNHKSDPCEHWKRVRWTDRNGNKKVNWYNDLVNKFEFADDWKIAMQEYVD